GDLERAVAGLPGIPAAGLCARSRGVHLHARPARAVRGTAGLSRGGGARQCAAGDGACRRAARTAAAAGRPAGAHPAGDLAAPRAAGRRLFGVIFWYVVLGPTGAVMFRAADILRHHAEVDSEATRDAARQLYGVLEW